ncbi:hypothetical protein E2C01_066574 [Portunus trituberculatus]|uniref:Uncharacterized protein n=1 Tax=Portunus trituberculatus TaxID=210409 RepID=A0A5B7HRB9_PORTR|nr:hypothetical protein [Portunus trituberculatus]
MALVEVLHARTFFYFKVSLFRNFPLLSQRVLPFLPSVRPTQAIICHFPTSRLPAAASRPLPARNGAGTIAAGVSPREEARPRGVNTAQTTLDFS